MKLEIKELGPIHDSIIDFSSDLTIIFGKSNQGKSYILRALYSFLSCFDEANNLELAGIISLDSTKKIPRNLVNGGQIEVAVNVKEGVIKLKDRWFSRLLTTSNVDFPVDEILFKIDEQSKVISIPPREYKPYGLICPNASYSLRLEYSRGVLKIDVEKSEGEIKDEDLCFTGLSGFILDSITKFLSTEVIPEVMNVVGRSIKVNSVRFLTYGRNAVLVILNSRSMSSFIPIFRSCEYWVEKGLRVQPKEEIDKIFNVKVRTEKGKIFINGYEIDKVSASLVELGSLYLATADGKGGLLMIEEPEAQLDVYKQITMGIILYNLSEIYKIVATTHSENLLLTLAMISYFSKRVGEKVKEAFNKYGELKLRDAKISFYLVEDGRIREMKDSQILSDASIFSETNREIFGINAYLLSECGDKCE